MTELASLDGAIAPATETTIPVVDEGFIRGDGVFEVIRVYDGEPFLLGRHLDRIERSARNLRLGYEPDRRALAAETDALLAERGGSSFDGCLRIVLTRGGRRLLITEPLPQLPERVRLSCVTYAPTRVLDGVKSLSYAANMLSSRLARERGFDEALLVTPHGRVLEAPTSSLFYVLGDGRLSTPPLDDHILESITRDLVLSALDVDERPLARDELGQLSEGFLASTIREVQPLATIDELEFGEPGPRTREAEEAFREHLLRERGGP